MRERVDMMRRRCQCANHNTPCLLCHPQHAPRSAWLIDAPGVDLPPLQIVPHDCIQQGTLLAATGLAPRVRPIR